MKTPGIKYKWGSEKFYRFYEPLAFRYADLVQADFLPAPNHPLVTRTNKKLFSTVEYDNYILLQGKAMQEHRERYLSACGTYKVNTDNYWVNIDPVNPIINQAPTENGLQLVPYSYPPYKAYQHSDNQIYKATLPDLNLVIEPINDDIGYNIYGIRGFFLRGSVELEENSYFENIVMGTVTYAYYRPDLQSNGVVLSPMFINKVPDISSGISPYVLSSFRTFIEWSKQWANLVVGGTPYKEADGEFFYIQQVYTPAEGDEEYKKTVSFLTNKNSITINNNSLTLELYTTESRKCMRLISSHWKNDKIYTYADNHSGSLSNLHGERISHNTTPSLDLFKPQAAILADLWANTETT